MVKKCNPKYMRTKYNYTPNDYDITFDVDKIPSNIQIEDVIDLTNQLQNMMPLSKKVHLNLKDYSPERHKKNHMGIYTRVFISVNGDEKEVDVI